MLARNSCFHHRIQICNHCTLQFIASGRCSVDQWIVQTKIQTLCWSVWYKTLCSFGAFCCHKNYTKQYDSVRIYFVEDRRREPVPITDYRLRRPFFKQRSGGVEGHHSIDTELLRSKQPQTTYIFLFCSFAHGDQTGKNDVDIVVEIIEPKSLLTFSTWLQNWVVNQDSLCVFWFLIVLQLVYIWKVKNSEFCGTW